MSDQSTKQTYITTTAYPFSFEQGKTAKEAVWDYVRRRSNEGGEYEVHEIEGGKLLLTDVVYGDGPEGVYRNDSWSDIAEASSYDDLLKHDFFRHSGIFPETHEGLKDFAAWAKDQLREESSYLEEDEPLDVEEFARFDARIAEIERIANPVTPPEAKAEAVTPSTAADKNAAYEAKRAAWSKLLETKGYRVEEKQPAKPAAAGSDKIPAIIKLFQLAALTICLSVGLAACAPSQVWTKPNATQSNFIQDKAACEMEASKAVPSKYTYQILAGDSYSSCDKHSRSCQTTFTPPSLERIDENKPLRDDVRDACIAKRGWQLVPKP